MKKLVYLLVAVSLVLVLVPAAAFAHTEGDPFVTDLIAGGGSPKSAMDVGDVEVWNDGDYLYVKYVVDVEGWCLTETHLQVATSLEEGIPQKNGNPIPGHFEENDEHDCVTEVLYTYNLVDREWAMDTTLFIAAHAVVQKVVTEAPYYASAVVDYDQGLRKNGTPVLEARSIPEQGLAFETGQNESNFFSLGFGGWISVEFACPIRNGEGNDVKVIEDTWGTYPLEKADVYASQDGITWTYLGEADNTTRDVAGIHSISEFDLDALDWAKYIKIVDTTNPAVHNDVADGYDLNAVVALQDCLQEETAWGDGTDFPGKNWAMYFTYTVQCPYEPGLLNGDFESPVVTHDKGWNIFTSAEVDWTVEWAGDYTGAPEDAYLELHRGVNGWDPYDGYQHAELDTDWQGPGSAGGEEASVRIYQDLQTCPDEEYTLTFAYSPRPGHPDNVLEVYWDSVLVDTYSADGSGNSNTVWTEVTEDVTASGWTTRLEFVEEGTPDSFGMFLDAVSVQKK